jgi:hypothetical protein
VSTTLRTAFALATLALLAGCAGHPRLHAPRAPARSATYALPFVAGPRVDAFAGPIERGGEWACEGEVVIARVASMPPDDGVLASDRIHELSPDGALIGTWLVPLESDPIAIAGDTLTVRVFHVGEQRAYALDHDGRITEVPLALPAQDPTTICPTDPLPESGYRQCARLHDSVTRLERLLAYEGPCT